MNPANRAALHARARLSAYLDQRRSLSRETIGSGIDERVLEMIRADVGRWAQAVLAENPVPYDRTSHPQIEATLLGLVSLLRRSYSEFVPELELQVTEAFVRMAFDVYEGAPVTESDTFAFLVPIRVSKRTPEYCYELVPLAPAMHYVPPSLRAQLMVGVPPYVLDTYRCGNMDGYLVCTPVYSDMFLDGTAASRRSLIETARSRIGDAVLFATTKLGARLVGLGGTLPSLTRYGQALDTAGTIVTTGHAGTISLVGSYVEDAMKERNGAPTVLGVVGLGAIGESIANYILGRYEQEAGVVVFDINPQRARAVSLRLRQSYPRAGLQQAQSISDLINRSDIVVSAATGKIDLDEISATGHAGLDLAGKLIIDDSQPASFDPAQVRRRGGRLTWVVARVGKSIERSWYDYGTMFDNKKNFFGCEAEVAVLAAEYRAMLESGATAEASLGTIRGIAVRRPATMDDVTTIRSLFGKYGVKASLFQAPELDQVVDLQAANLVQGSTVLHPPRRG